MFFSFSEKHTDLAYNVIALCAVLNLLKGYFALVHALIDFKCIHDFRFTPIGKVFILVRWPKPFILSLLVSFNRSRRVNTLLLKCTGNKCVWITFYKSHFYFKNILITIFLTPFEIQLYCPNLI